MIVKIRETIRRKILKTTFIMVLSGVFSYYLAQRLATIADPVWWDCYKISCVLTGVCFLIRYLFIFHEKWYFIDTDNRTIQKGKRGKPKKFGELLYGESFFQILFFVGTLEARGGELKRRIVLKDVPDSTVQKIINEAEKR